MSTPQPAERRAEAEHLKTYALDNRVSTRQNWSEDVEVVIDGESVNGIITDISLRGVCVNIDGPPPSLKQQVTIINDDLGELITEVISVRQNRVALEFADFAAARVRALKTIAAHDISAKLGSLVATEIPGPTIHKVIEEVVAGIVRKNRAELAEGEMFDVCSDLFEEMSESIRSGTGPVAQVPDTSEPKAIEAPVRSQLLDVMDVIYSPLAQRIEPEAAAKIPKEQLPTAVRPLLTEVLDEFRISLNASEIEALLMMVVEEMVGLGPLEPLLRDKSVTDILVNGIDQIYVERNGHLEVSSARFRDRPQLDKVIDRIVTRVGRRIDTSSPMVDARLEDGSRVNVIIPPLSVKGPAISIRKFSTKSITFDVMAKNGSISSQMATVLKIAARCRLNILVSGGTGAGKTTVLNALSREIDHRERIVTIEDAAELQLQQPHVLTLETRNASVEGTGKVTMRDLLINSLRMRPDRIIVGEVRGGEANDMLQAMNTGHDGSLSTIHANTPRDALSRLEDLVTYDRSNFSVLGIRRQVASALDLLVQVARMRDGKRRITHVSEIVGLENDVVTLNELFHINYSARTDDERFVCTGFRPSFMDKAEYFGLGDMLMKAMQPDGAAAARRVSGG